MTLRAEIDAFIDEAKGADLLAVFEANGWRQGGKGGHRETGSELIGPCPACGGVDCFSINPKKSVWNCRKSGGGRNAVSLVAHCAGLNLKTRAGWIEAAEIALGRDAPQPVQLSESERQAREAEQKAAAERRAAQAQAWEKSQNDFRDRERKKALGKWQAAGPVDRSPEVTAYLSARTGLPLSALGQLHLKASRDTLWHGQDDQGRPLAVHEGAVMVGGFVHLLPNGTKEVIGCHLTWIDPANPPKYRVRIPDRANPGEFVPAKKMRGSKKGGFIPLAGRLSASRWVGGEGIENGLAVAASEMENGQFREDTFYFAAGDLGNLAGPASPSGGFAHPHLKTDKGKPRRMPSPQPLEGQAPPEATDEAMPVPAHVRGIVLLADGDSETVWTATMMARARARLMAGHPDRLVSIAWPPAGMDFAEMVTG